MKIEKGIISSQQLMFLFLILLQTNTLSASFITGLAKQNAWFVSLLGFVISLFLLFVYTSLNKRFPNTNLVEINDKIFGCYLGKVISISYIYYYWHAIMGNVRFISDFFPTYLISEIDVHVISICLLGICIYAVKKGIEVIARASVILSLIAFFAGGGILLFSIRNINLSNFLPLFDINLKQIIQGTNYMVSIPFGEVVALLVFFPYVNDNKQVRKSAFIGFILGSIYFLAAILLNIAVLGNLGYIETFPSYQVAKLINVGDIITRTEVTIAIVLLFNEFLKICIFFYATVLCIAQLFKLRSYKHLVLPVGIISIISSITLLNSAVEHAYFGANVYIIYALLNIVIIPIISLTVDSIRKLFR